MAYDPIQKLLVIGDNSGSLRMYPFETDNNIINNALLLLFRSYKQISVRKFPIGLGNLANQHSESVI